MYPNLNEDVAWERLKDAQREAENRRLTAGAGPDERLYLAQLLVEKARALVRAIRSGRPAAAELREDGEPAARPDVA